MKKGISILLSLVTGAAGVAAGVGITRQKLNKIINWHKNRTDKFYDYFQLLNQWLVLKNSGRSLSEYFEKKGYKTIAIYGIGELGNRLVEELNDSDITVKYVIDKQADKVNTDLKVLTIEEAAEDEVDVIVVTPFYVYAQVEETLMETLNYPVVSVEDVVYSI